MKRVISVHGWGGAPEEGWRPWLGRGLAKHGIAFVNPPMPNPQYPTESEWVAAIAGAVGCPDTDTFLIGHSLGSIALLRYLETLSGDDEVGGVLLIAGFTDDLGISELSNFFRKPINWEAIRQRSERFVSIQSDNDPYDLAGYNKEFQDYLSAKTYLLHDRKHFSGDDGIDTFPEALEALVGFVTE